MAKKKTGTLDTLIKTGVVSTSYLCDINHYRKEAAEIGKKITEADPTLEYEEKDLLLIFLLTKISELETIISRIKYKNNLK